MFNKTSGVRSKLMRISSHDKTNPADSNSSFTIDVPSNIEGLNNLIGIQLLSAKIPNLFYNVDTKDLSGVDPILQLTYNGVEYDLTIPRGQYSFDIANPGSNDLIEAIKNEFLAQTGDALTITVDPVTLKLTFSTVANLLFITESNYNNSTGDLASILGFRLPRPTALPSNILPADTIYDLTGINDVYIHCRQLALQSIDLDTDNSISLIGSVDIDSPYGAVSHYQIGSSHANMISYPNRRYISEMDIRLRDSRGRLVNINGFDWTMIIKLYYVMQ